MKSSNLARRAAPFEEQPDPSDRRAVVVPARAQAIEAARIRARSRARRAIVIREQGFAPFRVR